MTIADEGLQGDYGANIGKVLLKCEGESIRVKAKAYAAAGSDARMNAGAAAGAGMAYLNGGGYKEVIHTIVNALAIVSGMV